MGIGKGCRSTVNNMKLKEEVKMKTKRFGIAVCILLIGMLVAPVFLMAADKINLNTATLEELVTLERIGPKHAQAIIDYRETYGPFEKIEDIMKVKGIGPKTFEANKDKLAVGEADALDDSSYKEPR
jgi:competence protein ComEA